MRRLQILPCPVPDALTQVRAAASGVWCSHCSRHVSHSRSLDAAGFEQLIHQATSSRVCMQLELDARRPKLRSGLAAGVLVVALAGCSTMDALAPPLSPRVFVDSEPLAKGDSQITGFVIGEDGNALSNAMVSLTGGTLTAPIEAVTNELGMYGFSNIPPGDYTLMVYSEQGIADASVSVAGQTRVQVSFRGPYMPEPTLIAGYVEVVEVAESGSFAQPGPFLVE